MPQVALHSAIALAMAKLCLIWANGGWTRAEELSVSQSVHSHRTTPYQVARTSHASTEEKHSDTKQSRRRSVRLFFFFCRIGIGSTDGEAEMETLWPLASLALPWPRFKVRPRSMLSDMQWLAVLLPLAGGCALEYEDGTCTELVRVSRDECRCSWCCCQSMKGSRGDDTRQDAARFRRRAKHNSSFGSEAKLKNQT
ncbi:hypothetical protein V8C42DRAFT_322522 [Trichoderma barbatum]